MRNDPIRAKAPSKRLVVFCPMIGKPRRRQRHQGTTLRAKVPTKIKTKAYLRTLITALKWRDREASRG